MEEIAYLFNADFEQKLVGGLFNKMELSKINQEFEYLIHWLDPSKRIYSNKIYDSVYNAHLLFHTGSQLTCTVKGKVQLFCQDFSNGPLKLRLSNKFNTMDFLLENDLINYSVKFLSELNELKEEGLYKAPFGMSGSGHLSYPRDKKKILEIFQRHNRVLREPRLERHKDFSTLFKNGKVITTYENYIDHRFQYRGSYFSPEKVLTGDMEEKYGEFIPLFKKYIAGYEDILSVDGFLFEKGNAINPCCEINTRKTMGYIAYNLWKKYFKCRTHFKFLLFKNEFEAQTLNTFYTSSNKEVLLLSPSSNQFVIFCVGTNGTKEMLKVEKELVFTLFNRL